MTEYIAELNRYVEENGQGDNYPIMCVEDYINNRGDGGDDD